MSRHGAGSHLFGPGNHMPPDPPENPYEDADDDTHEARIQRNTDEATLLRIMRHGGHVRSFTHIDGSYDVEWTWEPTGEPIQSAYGRGASFAEAVRDSFKYGGPWDAS